MMADTKLKKHYDSINKLLDERDDVQEKIRREFEAVAENGYVPKVLRRVITVARMDPDKRAQLAHSGQLEHEYATKIDDKTRIALEELKEGSTLNVAAAKAGVSRSTAARRKAVSKNRKDEIATVSENQEVESANANAN